MNKTIQLKGEAKHTGLIVGSVVAAVLVLALFGIQSAHAVITSQLDFGDRGSEVTELQTYLATNASIYPSGLVTGYFGPLTQAGVQRFQAANGIVSSGTPTSTGYGRIGPRTQAAINAKLAGGNPSADVHAPLIRNVDVSTHSNGATVTWTASEASMGKVYYDTAPIRLNNTFDATGVFSGEPTAANGTLAQYDGVARTTHAVNINNLMTNTTYYYVIVAFDSSKNVSITTPDTFRTN